MKRYINVLLIALALFLALPVTVKAEQFDPELPCSCGHCYSRLPAMLFNTFEEWENYYLSHREQGIYWDSYLYRFYANRHDKDGNVVWQAPVFYPFKDYETWSNWWGTCLEKESSGEYQYEFLNEGNKDYWARRNRPCRTEQTAETVYIEPMDGLEETPTWKINLSNGWNVFLEYLGIR